jgi:hypothetical protein
MLVGMAKPFAKLVALIKPKRRWAQFSLTTLFVVVTVLCVGLGIVVAPVARQRRAVAVIEALNGRVGYVPNKTLRKAFSRPFRLWLPRDYLVEVKWVDLTGTQVTDARLADLQGLPRLESLSLMGTPVTDDGLAQLHRPTRLRNLNLLYTHQVTDAGLAQLRQAMPNCEIVRTWP